ncbi:hypothetical protein HPB47_011259 [Ixodes persulcatus]|uniref:Uncharacterized protein n=1 Tax=Ixodes persulcatus TaxID=34615 RepID=A0AC60NWT9_IXOPE|nr:hypothetical protein HPB47_011259 [Ixodes persulcatus]
MTWFTSAASATNLLSKNKVYTSGDIERRLDFGNQRVVREIVNHDKRLVKEVDVQWNTPLHAAANGGFNETAGVLVEAGAALEAKNYYERTPVSMACQNGDSDTVATLLGAGASVHSVDNMKVRITQSYHQQFNVSQRNVGNVVEALLKSSFWKELLRNATDSEQHGVHQTPLRKLIRFMPDLAELVFENCVVEESASNEDPNHSVTYHYEFLDDSFASYGAADDSTDEINSDSVLNIPGRKLYDERGNVLPGKPLYSRDFGTIKRNHPLMMMVDDYRRALLGHELCKSLLDHKWKSYGSYVYHVCLIVYLVYLAYLTSFVLHTPTPCPLDFPHFNTTCSFVPRFKSCAVIGNASDKGLYLKREFVNTAKLMIIIICVIIFLKEPDCFEKTSFSFPGPFKTNNDFFVTALELLIDLIVFGKFPPYEVDRVVFRAVSRVYEHYEGKEKEWPTHEGPFIFFSGWVNKVTSRVTEAETMDVVEFLSDTVHTIKWIIFHVYESYKVRDKEWESHEQPFVLLSQWSCKVSTKVTASETTDMVEFISDTLKTIKRAMRCKHQIEATYIHYLTTDVLRYRLITVDTVDSWK